MSTYDYADHDVSSDGDSSSAARQQPSHVVEEELRYPALRSVQSSYVPDRPDYDPDSFDENDPPGNRVCCVEEDDVLLITITSGSNDLVRWLGWFCLAWLTITTAAMAYEILVGTDNAPAGIAVLVVAWIGGFSTLCYWIRVRFAALEVLIDAQCLATRYRLFGLSWGREFALAGFSKAKLVVAHRADHQPVYAVSIAVADTWPQFGAFLTLAEKSWLVRRINRHLGRDDGNVFGAYIDPQATGAEWVAGEIEFGE